MITAIFIPMISIAATSKTPAITSAACRASSRYPDPPENLSHFSTNASIDSPKFSDVTFPADCIADT
ncbi:hypothetical protein [Streptomyces sp. NPDC002790]|uniref:hypothetical protein n=1 Tax=Streptomyces sp. NPDC002790 TaxID=3154431 RepID=UPI00331A076C